MEQEPRPYTVQDLVEITKTHAMAIAELQQVVTAVVQEIQKARTPKPQANSIIIP